MLLWQGQPVLAGSDSGWALNQMAGQSWRTEACTVPRSSGGEEGSCGRQFQGKQTLLQSLHRRRTVRQRGGILQVSLKRSFILLSPWNDFAQKPISKTIETGRKNQTSCKLTIFPFQTIQKQIYNHTLHQSKTRESNGFSKSWRINYLVLP